MQVTTSVFMAVLYADCESPVWETSAMKRTAMIALLLAAPAALAQTATEEQNRIVGEVAACMQEGLPPNWANAEMVLELNKPGAETGEVRFLTRCRLAGGAFEAFRPCDEKKAARTLLEIRKSQSPARRNWTSARLILRDDGTYDLSFEYPK
jgi:hypothetical protein